MIGKAVNHGGHSEHGEEKDLIWDGPIAQWVTTKKGLKLKLFAVSAVLAVVESGFEVEERDACVF